MKKTTFLILTVLLPGCGGQTVIDGSSPEAFMSSIDQMQENLPPEEKQQFLMSVSQLIIKYNLEKLKEEGFAETLPEKSPQMAREEFLTSELLAELDGMAASEVIEHAKNLNFAP